ncbi:MAG TPA: ATP-binding protein [Acidimicrobiales bacterium]|nr:ATP-binding protein [Acidimicrobiales bacterium]
MNLAPAPTSALEARDAVQRALGEVGGRDSAVTLVTSELVTNAILHAGTPVTMRVSLEPGGRSARVEVHDNVPPGGRALGASRAHPPGQATSGRGLAMVSWLASEWGVRREDSGKTVWAVVPLNQWGH